MKPIRALPTALFLATLCLSSLSLTACKKDPQVVMQDAAKAMGSGDYETAEDNFRWLLERTPGDTTLQANLAFALTSQGKHDEAIAMYRKLVGGGEGTYDLFAYYAKSLDAAGKLDEAITWNYRALTLVPQLVDVRGELAKQLVKKGRPFEALSLLASFDDELESNDKPAYFKAQRIAISSALPAPVAGGADTTLKAVNLAGHFYAVVVADRDVSLPFMIDTGATHTTMSNETLQSLGARVPASAHTVALETADGRTVYGQEFVLPNLQVGPYALKDIKVVTCENCESLLGQTSLERFDLKTAKTDGLDILTMTLRPAAL